MNDDEERPSQRQGARPGPVEGDTPQAAELAQWLRERTAGLTVRQLAERFRYGRSQWSEFLRGRKLIPLWLLEDVVTALVPGPQNQQMQRAIGRELLEAAEHADAARRAAHAPQLPDGTAHELQIRLDDARQGQIQAQQTLHSLTRLIYTFLSMVADLRQRCATLEAERDQARQRLEETNATVTQQRLAETEQHLAATEQQLAETEQRLEGVEDLLARTRWEQQEAEYVRIRALQRAEQHRRAYEQRTGDTPTEPVDEETGAVTLPQLWEYDHALEAADAQLHAHSARLSAIRERLGIPAPSQSQRPRTILGQVVPDPSTDSPDNAPTSSGSVRADSTDNADGSAALASPDRTRANTPGAGGSAAGAAGGPRGRRRPGRRTVLVGMVCLSLLAAGVWFARDQWQPSPSDSQVLRRADRLGKLVIGTKAGQPGLSMEKDGKWSGFDVELARRIADRLGFPEDKIKFVPVGTNSRETMIKNKKVDLVVGSYSINAEREKEVAFAGPYLLTGQRLLMRRGDTEGTVWVNDDETGSLYTKEVRSYVDLPPKTDVCTAADSTSQKKLESLKTESGEKQFDVTPLTDYDLCISGLLDTTYEVLSTDDVILAGYQAKYPNQLVTIGGDMSHEKYGIGMEKNDSVLHELVCDALEKEISSGRWDQLFKDNLGKIGVEETSPPPRTRC
ncbi:transporter substrate-binding domain-containing protein [Streptomyces malaysiensis]|uniref:transporter substrate-binding domain-containing protein n=1 Tax=Streptomyces malaysiensis TaxID=92644 RepID=UPI003F4CB711